MFILLLCRNEGRCYVMGKKRRVLSSLTISKSWIFLYMYAKCLQITQISFSAGFPTHLSSSPVGGIMVPYSSSPSSLPRESPVSNARERSNSLKDRSGSFDKGARRSSPYEVESPTSRVPYCQSPPNMEGPISFVAPELAEETLMDVSLSSFLGF